jgi:signal transduction histidine kinase
MTSGASIDKKRELAALVVHDLRNPLTALLGNIRLLSGELEAPSSEVRDMLRDMEELTQRALGLANTLLDVEELEEGILRAVLEEVDVEVFARQISQHHRATIQLRELRLDFQVEPGCRGVFDPNLMGRVLENLLDNSVRYAPRRGKVVVRARRVEDAVIFDVGNNGPPVPDGEREHVFDKHYRLEARRAGALANRGLGLYFCRLAVEAHGGTINIVQEEELPTVFRARVPG